MLASKGPVRLHCLPWYPKDKPAASMLSGPSYTAPFTTPFPPLFALS